MSMNLWTVSKSACGRCQSELVDGVDELLDSVSEPVKLMAAADREARLEASGSFIV